MGIFRTPHLSSVGDTPKKLTKEEKRVAPSPPEDRTPKKGKGSTSPTYAAATRGQTPQKDEECLLVEIKKKQKKKKKEKKVPVPSAQDPKEKTQRVAKALSGRQVGRRYQGVGEGGRVLRRYPESYEGKGKPPKCRSGGILHPENQEGGDPPRPQKGGCISAFEKALALAVGEKAEVKSLVSKRSLDRTEVPAWVGAKNSSLSRN